MHVNCGQTDKLSLYLISNTFLYFFLLYLCNDYNAFKRWLFVVTTVTTESYYFSQKYLKCALHMEAPIGHLNEKKIRKLCVVS